MTTGIGCTVYADGVRLADGSPSDDPRAPNVLSGLEVAWGRDTTVDQPEASTLTFALADPDGGAAFSDRLRTGTAIEVRASGTVYPDPTESTFPDPGFETGLPGVVRSNATVTRTDRGAPSGGYALRLDPIDGARRASVVIAPAPFVAAGTEPDAWDAIPATAYGQTWSYGATVTAPPGAAVLVRPVTFWGPYADAGEVVASAPALAVTGTGAPQTVAGTFTPNVDAQWVGLEVMTYPTGLAWDQVSPDVTWDDLAGLSPSGRTDWQWDDLGAVLVDDVQVLAPASGVVSEVLVYAGRVVSLTLSWDEGDPTVAVSCVDFVADLDNVNVGEEPWLAEPMGDRFNRILGLTGLPITAEIDASVGAIPVTWRDVDRQAAGGLLAELAESTDAVMWSATHLVSGPYLRVEDPTNRPSTYVLALVDGVVVIIANPDDTTADLLPLSACDVLRDDVEWTQDTSDVVTRATVTWQLEGTDDDGKTTTEDQTVEVIDADAEARQGVRGLSLSSQLRTAADATEVAERLLARTSVTDWRASGLVIDDLALEDTTDADVTGMLTLLDGTSRNGLGLRLDDLPAWSPSKGKPVAVFLEGGKYTFEDGAWLLDLIVSNGTAQGASATWDDLDPTWTWDQFSPAITWDDLRGVGVADGSA
jgi:hypothetical protein